MFEEERKIFKRIHGYELDLNNPLTFNEKIVCKKLFDRNPLIPLTSDKYRAREYIRERIGLEAEKHFIPLLDVVDNPKNLKLDYEGEYIIKPNNAAGKWIIKDKIRYTVDSKHTKYADLSKKQIIDICKKWLTDDYSSHWNEWAYSKVEPLIIVEKLLRDSKGNIPNDYRICMFGEKC